MTWRRADYGFLHGVEVRDNTGPNPYQIEQRVYRTGQRIWPRLILTTWHRDGGVSLIVQTSNGKAAEGWHARDGIPPELIDDAIEMLTKAKARVGG